MNAPDITKAKCACGASDIVAVHPGADRVKRGATDLFTRTDPTVEPPRADIAWCRACWDKRFGRKAS